MSDARSKKTPLNTYERQNTALIISTSANVKSVDVDWMSVPSRTRAITMPDNRHRMETTRKKTSTLVRVLILRTSHENVPLRKVKTHPRREVKTHYCYKSKRTSMFPYNINILLDIINKTSFIIHKICLLIV